MEEYQNSKKSQKKSKQSDEESKKNNNNSNTENVYEFLKEENKKALFDKLINNFNENFLTEQKLTNSRQSQIPYFKFENNEINSNVEEENKKKDNEEFEIIRLGETKEIVFGNDIIYDLALMSDYVIAVSKEHMKMFDLEDPNFKEVKSVNIKGIFFYCVDATKIDNIYYIAFGGNTNSIFLYTIDLENENDIKENIEELIGHKNDINDLKFLTVNQNILISASSDSTVRLWDVKQKKLLCIYGGPFGHPSHVLTVDFHFSEQFIASAGFDQVVMFWDIDFVLKKYINNKENSFKCVLKTKPFFETLVHENYIDTVKFVGDLVLSKSTNGVILLWKPMFNDEKDHHFIIKKLFYTSSKIWYIKFHLNLAENLLFIGDVGGMYIFDLNNHKNSNSAMPDVFAQIPKSKSEILFRCVNYDSTRNLMIIGKDNGKLCFTKLSKIFSNINENSFAQ
jgi:polycomb protein EED